MTNEALADELDALAEWRPIPGPRCTVGQLLVTLAATDPLGAEKLHKHIEGSTPLTALSEILFSSGYMIRPGTISRHRRRGTPRGCACPR